MPPLHHLGLVRPHGLRVRRPPLVELRLQAVRMVGEQRHLGAPAVTDALGVPDVDDPPAEFGCGGHLLAGTVEDGEHLLP